jgi:hypothetical protein
MGATDTNLGRSQCDTRRPEDVLAGNICGIGDATVSIPTFAVLGDSFAISLEPAIETVASQARQKGVNLIRGGCYPLLGASQFDDFYGSCREFVRAAMEFLNAHTSISSVIIIARWTSAAEGTRFGGRDMYITDDYSSVPSYDENKKVFVRSLERTIRALRGRTIFVVSTIPEHFVDVPRMAALGRYLGREISVDLNRYDFDQRQGFVRNTLGEMADRLSFQVLDLSQYLCTEHVCAGTKDGYSLYSDGDHLNRFGALTIREVFSPVFHMEPMKAAR